MDQLKEILRQAIKYRFWIAVGLSALLPMIAYFVGVGAVQTQAKQQEDAIVAAEKDVKQYASGNVINDQYQPVVARKTEDLTKDVNATWRTLYARQAPLLTWPERVHKTFTAWGRQWPKDTDPSAVQFAIIDYINAYPAYVDKVYATFKPFDPIEGKGVVSAPPKEVLLRPAVFAVESPPSLGKVWAAQERLWIQHTMLDVVRAVNKDAEDWDHAIIRQINELEVGSPLAQDQRSIAKGEALKEAEPIDDPNKPAEAAAPAGEAGGAPAGMGGSPGGMPGMPGMMGSAMMGANAPETVSYIDIPAAGNSFKVMPVEMSVLIDQEHVQDLLVALENSPMTIQVMDFELQKPIARVTKPEKGASMAMMGYGMMPGMMPGAMESMMMGRGGMMPGMMGYGGNMARMMGGMGGMDMMPGYGGMMGPGMGASPKRTGVDVRSKSRGKEAEERAKAARKGSGVSLQDPYFNIVEVRVYGQARFFMPPPAEEAPAPSQADAGANTAAPAPAAEGDAAKKAEAEPAKKDEAPKAEAEPAKAEAEPKAGDEASKKGEAPKAEDAAKKSETPKAEAEPAKKDEAPKADGGDAKKAEAPKADGGDATPKK